MLTKKRSELPIYYLYLYANAYENKNTYRPWLWLCGVSLRLFHYIVHVKLK